MNVTNEHGLLLSDGRAVGFLLDFSEKGIPVMGNPLFWLNCSQQNENTKSTHQQRPNLNREL